MTITHRKRNAWLAEVRPLANHAVDLPLDFPALEAAEQNATDKYLAGKRILPGSSRHAEAYRKLMAFVRPREPSVAAFSERVEAPRLRGAILAAVRSNLRESGRAMVYGEYGRAALCLSRAEADYMSFGDDVMCRQGQRDTHAARLAAGELAAGNWVDGALRLTALLLDVNSRDKHPSRSQLSALCPALENLLDRMWRADKSFLKNAPQLVAALMPLLELDDVFVFAAGVRRALLEELAPSTDAQGAGESPPRAAQRGANIT